ncbi:MAG: Uma2 family endonuclease [Gemmataceae bacterium]
MSIAAEKLLTVEEYRVLPDRGYPTELVGGRIVPMNMPSTRHGFHCARIVYILSRFLEDHPSGRIVSNDSGIVTEHGPDTVRGADVAYYSYSRLPKGPLPEGYSEQAPEILFEVRSPRDRRAEILAKVAEFQKAGVLVVCVLDSQSNHLAVYRADEVECILKPGDVLSFPGILDGFSIDIARFFE